MIKIQPARITYTGIETVEGLTLVSMMTFSREGLGPHAVEVSKMQPCEWSGDDLDASTSTLGAGEGGRMPWSGPTHAHHAESCLSLAKVKVGKGRGRNIHYVQRWQSTSAAGHGDDCGPKADLWDILISVGGVS